MEAELQGNSAQGLSMQTPVKVAASSSHTPFKVSHTPSKQASKLVKVVFNLTYEPSSQTEEVWVYGTDTSLDMRQMQRTSFKDGGCTIWTSYCYSPELIEFEYRYTSKEPGFDMSVWESNHMRKCRVPSHAAGKVELEDKWGIIPLPVPQMTEEPTATPAKTPCANMSIANSSINGSGFLSPLLLEGPPVTREAMATSFEALKGLVERTKRDLKRMKEKNESLEQQVAQRALESGTLTETLAQCEQERAESTARLHSLEQFVCSVEQAWGMSRKELLMSAAPMIKDAEGRKLQQYLAAATEAQQQLRLQAQQQLADVQQQLTLTVAAITEQVGLQFKQMEEELVDTRAKHRKEMQERKRLHNQLLELRGNIRVFCRVRPLNSREKESCVTFPEEANICIEQGKGKDAKVFQFDHVFGPQSTQSEVFEEMQPLITSMLDGYNVCIFAYGQTGTGKTHTMEGYGDQPGVNTRALQALFDLAKERKKLFTYDIKVSILEIYNETLVDLLVGRSGAKLEVKPHPEGGTHVPELNVVPVTCMQDVQRLMDKGKANRSVGATCMNEHSSRSHCILSVYTESRAVATGARAQGKLHLIDLAGSERVGRSGATGDRLKEAQNINQSLSALGDVVAALIAKQKHVPFRNSKLTFFLQDSLGGDSKALMFVQASPSVDDAGETLCSLTFAARVRNIELGPAKKRADTTGALALKAVEGECEKLKAVAAVFEQRASAAEAEVAELRSGLQGSRAQQEEEVRSLRLRLEQAQKKAADAEAASAALERARAAAEGERVKAVVEKQRAEKEAQLAVRQAEIDKASAIAAAARVSAAPATRMAAGESRRLSSSRGSAAAAAAAAIEDKENSPMPPAPPATLSGSCDTDAAASALFAATKRRSSDRLRIKMETSEPLHNSKKQAWEDEAQTSPKHRPSTSATSAAPLGDSQPVAAPLSPISRSLPLAGASLAESSVSSIQSGVGAGQGMSIEDRLNQWRLSRMQQQQQQQLQPTAAVTVDTVRPVLARSRLENDSPNAPANSTAPKRAVRPASGSCFACPARCSFLILVNQQHPLFPSQKCLPLPDSPHPYLPPRAQVNAQQYLHVICFRNACCCSGCCGVENWRLEVNC